MMYVCYTYVCMYVCVKLVRTYKHIYRDVILRNNEYIRIKNAYTHIYTATRSWETTRISV
jgi:hypothetical protein